MIISQNNKLSSKTLAFYGNGPIRVNIISASQSNGVGWTTSQIANLPVNLRAKIKNGYIYNPSSGLWEILQAGVNNLGQSSLYHGIEITLLDKLVSLFSSQIGLIKYCVGGTPYFNDNTANNWNSLNVLPGNLFDTMISQIQSSISAFGREVIIDNFITYHGETDSQTLSWANAYESNGNAIKSRIRSQLNLPDLFFIHIKPHSNISGGAYPYTAIVRTAIDNMVLNDPLSISL